MFPVLLQDRFKGCFSVFLFDSDIYWKAKEYVCDYFKRKIKTKVETDDLKNHNYIFNTILYLLKNTFVVLQNIFQNLYLSPPAVNEIRLTPALQFIC